MWYKIAGLMIIATSASFLFTPVETEGRVGGRDGGGGDAGGGRRRGGDAPVNRGAPSGNTINRTPTMSRASSRPTLSQPRQQIKQRQQMQTGHTISQPRQQMQTRPSVSQGRGKQVRQTVQQRPTTANRAELHNQINQYAQNRPRHNIDHQALNQKAQNFSNNRNHQITQNRQLSENVSQRFHHSRPGSKQWFDRNFFNRHHIERDYVGAGVNWWRPATWGRLAGWGAWNWSTPYYYDDDGYAYPLSAESIYVSPYSSYTTSYLPLEAGSSQVDQVIVSSSETWLPLGVFAVANNADAAAYSNRIVQLAINRNGEIAGVLYNSLTDNARDLTGMVDPASQIAYWYFADRADSPIASTGIYNLTEDQTSINVHFPDGSDQTWTLVRLQQQK